MKIASWNVNSLNVRLPHLLDWLASGQPDVLVLQETKLEDHKFPQAEIEASGYHVVFDGQKTYNGVAILSKTGITDVQRGASETGSASSQVLSAAQSLSSESNRLKLEVGKFLDTVRAA